MKRPRNLGRGLVVAGTLGALVLAVSSIALAGNGSAKAGHKGARERVRHFVPENLRGAPELSAVVFDSTSKTFVELQFDRGVIMHVDATARTITLLQRQDKQVWRTMTFTIPASADIIVDGRTVKFDRLRRGEHARITQSGAPGGSLTIVRVDAQRMDRDVAFPPDQD
jgi:hypothetical protein